MVKISEILDNYWKKYHKSYVMFNYVAFEIGIFRIFPGISIYKRFDPVKRPWLVIYNYSLYILIFYLN